MAILNIFKTAGLKLKMFSELVMFSHTLFSLPFAIISMVWAAGGWPSGHVMIWGLIALIGARNGANAFNRLADRTFDEQNPRTAHRHLPQRLLAEKRSGCLCYCQLCHLYCGFRHAELALPALIAGSNRIDIDLFLYKTFYLSQPFIFRLCHCFRADWCMVCRNWKYRIYTVCDRDGSYALDCRI